MTRAKKNGNGRLEDSLLAMQQAMANLAQHQTMLMIRMADMEAEIKETNRVNSDRFARIETMLAEHSRALADLPEAVHRRFGFQPPKST
jgi:hypothetical protein